MSMSNGGVGGTAAGGGASSSSTTGTASTSVTTSNGSDAAGPPMRQIAGQSDDDSGCALEEYTWVPPGLKPDQVSEPTIAFQTRERDISDKKHIKFVNAWVLPQSLHYLSQLLGIHIKFYARKQRTLELSDN